MPSAKPRKIEVVLPVASPKKHSTRYEEADGANQALSNVYLKARGVDELGNPSAIKVTIEAYNADA